MLYNIVKNLFPILSEYNVFQDLSATTVCLPYRSKRARACQKMQILSSRLLPEFHMHMYFPVLSSLGAPLYATCFHSSSPVFRSKHLTSSGIFPFYSWYQVYPVVVVPAQVEVPDLADPAEPLTRLPGCSR